MKRPLLPYRPFYLCLGRRRVLRPPTPLPTRPVIIPSGFGAAPSTPKMACKRQGQPEQASSSSLIRRCRIKLGAGRRAQAIHAPVAALLILPVVIYSVLMIASVAVTVATIPVHRSAQFWHSGSSSEEYSAHLRNLWLSWRSRPD